MFLDSETSVNIFFSVLAQEKMKVGTFFHNFLQFKIDTAVLTSFPAFLQQAPCEMVTPNKTLSLSLQIELKVGFLEKLIISLTLLPLKLMAKILLDINGNRVRPMLHAFQNPTLNPCSFMYHITESARVCYLDYKCI